ncbi:hypothetical protein AeMF1_016569, partial [Aphanomyces euteiches]
NNNYSASKKGKGNNNHDNDNQGHAIDNSESGKQAERNEVQESASTGAYGMAVDDDALNKGNINDEVAMRKAKKAEYNKRAREKKRQAILNKANEELAMEKTKKAAYNKRAREKKREALLEEVDKAKKAEYNNRARGQKRQALLEEVDKSKKAEYKNRTHKKKRSDIVEDFDKEVAVKRSKKAEYNKRAREKKRNTEVANQGQDIIVCTIRTWIRATKRSPKREKTDSITTLKVTIISSFWQLRSKKITSAELTIEGSMRYNLTV